MRIHRILAWILAAQLLAPVNLARAQGGSTLVFERGSTGMAESSSANLTAPGSSFTGAATYSIPIVVAPGTAGMQPVLAITYSSHSARESSWLGAGWNLAGLGAISRSLENGVPDGVDPMEPPDQVERKFVLDGMELLEDGQGFYHTRRESFLRIRFITATNSFWEVRAKDGTVSRYGSSRDGSRTDCRIAKPGGGPTFAWLLCEREDPNGNALAVFYDNRGDAGTTYPKEIRYTLRRGAGGLESISSGHDRVVEFVTEVRPDTTEGYRSGFLEKQTQRLLQIDVSVDGSLAQGGALLRRYEFDYGSGASPDSFRSLLRAVKLYGADAASNPADSAASLELRLPSEQSGLGGWHLLVLPK